MTSAFPYRPPAHNMSSFNCPRCHAFSNQSWKQLTYSGGGGLTNLDGVKAAICAHCGKPSLWYEGRLVDPAANVAPLANPDLPPELLKDYEEASRIVATSPRGAAALLRLVIQKLCVFLKQPGKDINSDIAALVKAGLPLRVQQALDVVRVTGNNAVHPGQIDVDDSERATQLFHLVNIIVEHTVSQPKQIEALYASLPEAQRDAIQRRDQ